jgi:hypothetical protein
MAGYDFNIEQEPNLLSNLELAAHQDLVPIRIEIARFECSLRRQVNICNHLSCQFGNFLFVFFHPSIGAALPWKRPIKESSNSQAYKKAS